LAKDFSIGDLKLTKSTVQKIIDAKDKILTTFDDKIGAKRKRLITGRYEDFYSAFDQIEDLLLKDQLAKMKQLKITTIFPPQ
jgi:hypothetical protein